MFFKSKKQNQSEIKKFKLSNAAVLFIKKYACPNMNIDFPIDEDGLDKIVDMATMWEIDMIDPSSKDGCDKDYDYPERERNEMANKFVSEITGQWDDEKLTPDFNDLNERLGK